MISKLLSKPIGLVWLVSAPALLTAQVANKKVDGIVKNESGMVLSGVSVKVKDGTATAVTDRFGHYQINAAPTDVLIFSYIGMQTSQVPVGNQALVNVTLTAAATQLEDVVVVGYGTMRRADVTSSISSVSAEAIKDLPVAGADQMLQGKVAGVSVSANGGQPGGGISVRVRGLTSINGNEPLYVIDGIIVPTGKSSIAQDKLGGMAGSTSQSGIAGINPNDIEKIDILKDASAQAIYGSRGANGVVLITTKRGKAGEGKVSYDMYYGESKVPTRLDLMNLSQFAQYNNQVLQEISTVTGNPYVPIGEYQRPEVLGEGTNWQDAIFQKGKMQNHQLSFSGGSEKTTYYLGLNYFKQDGTIINSGFDRLSLRFNLDHQIKSWLKVGISSSTARTNQKTTLTNGSDAIVNVAAFNSPAAPVFGLNGDFAPPVSIGGYAFGNPVNPVALAQLRQNTGDQFKAFGSVYGELIFTKFLTMRNEINYDVTNDNNMSFQPSLSSGGTTILAPSKIVEQRNPSYYWALRNYLNYNQSFGQHNINAQIGHEAQASYYDNILASRQNLALNIPSIAAGEQENQVIEGGKGDWAMESYFVRAGYAYDNRYSVNLSLRRDGSSNFGPDRKLGYFPAASVGWTVTNEKFAKNLKVLNYLKVRAGVGAVGSSNVGGASYATNIRLFATGPFGAGGVPDNVGNPALGWESVTTYNGGFDAGFLNGRLDVTFDIYKKITSDMLMATRLPKYTGIGTEWNDIKSPNVNAGRMTNTGFDIGISSTNINKNGFTWKTNLVLSHYKNRLDKLNSDQADLMRYTEYSNAVILTRTVPGGPIGRFYGFISDGLFTSEDDLHNHANQGQAIGAKGLWLGDVKYRDLDGNNVINDGDMTYIGDPNPNFTFGLTNSFKYKGFDLSVFLQGSQGNDILNYTKRSLETPVNVYWNQLQTSLTDRYSELFNTNGTVPRYNQWHQDNKRVSSRFVEDGSYLRIQNITLGYNLPAAWINRIKMQAARIYISGQNIYTFTKYSGYDPELGSYNNDALMQNIDLGNYPNPRTFTIGANITF